MNRRPVFLVTFAFLEKELHVCWLWPGAVGEVIPKTANLVANNYDHLGKPALLHARIRTGYPFCTTNIEPEVTEHVMSLRRG